MLGINHDNVIIRIQEHIPHFHLCKEGFPRTGYAEDKTVTIYQPLPVAKEEVAADLVHAIISAALPRKVKLLHVKGHEYRKGLCHKCTHSFYLTHTYGQGCI